MPDNDRAYQISRHNLVGSNRVGGRGQALIRDPFEAILAGDGKCRRKLRDGDASECIAIAVLCSSRRVGIRSAP
jgi:hypothetical protein